MPEQMTKQDAIEYLLYMKHDVQAKSYMDIALDTAIEALKQPTIEPEVRLGRWIPLNGWMNKGIVKCSICGNTLNLDGVNAGRGDANFCPHCGARMDGGADNAESD